MLPPREQLETERVAVNDLEHLTADLFWCALRTCVHPRCYFAYTNAGRWGMRRETVPYRVLSPAAMCITPGNPFIFYMNIEVSTLLSGVVRGAEVCSRCPRDTLLTCAHAHVGAASRGGQRGTDPRVAGAAGDRTRRHAAVRAGRGAALAHDLGQRA